MLKALIIKEFIQIRRNSFLPRFIFVFPIVIMIIIPFITTLDVHDIHVTVVDYDHSSLSRRIVSDMDASRYIILDGYANAHEEALALLEHGTTDVIVEIPDDYEKNIVQGMSPSIQLSANAVNAVKGMLGIQYTMESIGLASADKGCLRCKKPVSELIVVNNRYNPTMNYRFYMIPAIMIMLLIILCGFLPALSIVNEKEKGTLEQINVTPVSRFTFTMSKLIPYWIIGLVVLGMAVLIAFIVHGLSPAGSMFTIFCGAFLFIFSISGLGVAVANCSDSMQQTMFVMFFFMIIFILMSGLLTPISSMPLWAQNFTMVFPPRYFVEIMRSVYLRGAAFDELIGQMLPLSVFAVVFNVMALLSYHKKE